MGGASKNADEDNFFNQKTPSTTEKRTLDKNSIMALYNQGGATTSAAVPPMQNMFASQGVYSTPQPSYKPNPSMNQSAFGSSPSMNQTNCIMALRCRMMRIAAGLIQIENVGAVGLFVAEAEITGRIVRTQVAETIYAE
ncbi:hypothetical protein DAPPUDRAFT_322948 [Daphnia pulex]|uniref:Uncharacterized protein n=1 Tax=Daphnia pulex TaxID=6669 RepID=E9GXE3_DAPPU|nr:hypothetical protein DAPPUDRAFT_322948 [Daphnia pulex]|eukprot:EFX75854.1 hypothetical protein DAPPUDRAFT_322948 [Daphnia pulex]